MTTPSTRVVIDCRALAHNYRQICARVEDRGTVMAMVKSDAYGHGLVEAASVFASCGCTSFGVAETAEGVRLRESGCGGEILVFLGFDPGDIDYLFSHRLTPVVFLREDLERIGARQRGTGDKLPVYLKFDCGMSRLGFQPSAAQSLFSICRDLGISVAGIMSHYPCSDDPASPSTARAFERFSLIAPPRADSFRFRRSICNSGGILNFPHTQGDFVRAGISLYGYYPDGAAGSSRADTTVLRPAMSVRTRVLQVQHVAAGSGISYGHTYVAPRDTVLAVLPAGYGNGYFRALSNRAEVLINGRRAPVRGRICMNMCMADITDIAGVRVGDEVVLLGSQQEACIDADEIGGWAGTISYEVLCSLGNNNPRHHLREQ